MGQSGAASRGFIHDGQLALEIDSQGWENADRVVGLMEKGLTVEVQLAAPPAESVRRSKARSAKQCGVVFPFDQSATTGCHEGTLNDFRLLRAA